MVVPSPYVPRRFVILGNGQKERVREEADTLRNLLLSHGAEIEHFDLSGEKPVEMPTADLAIVLGGDGAILRSAHQMGENQIPVLGVNLGRLGFLADLTPDDFRCFLPKLLAGELVHTEHVMLDVEVTGESETKHFRALNEMLISAGPPFKMIDVALSIDGESVITFSGDGLILSTPIGSTAHSLAAGGPILVQSLPAVVITPICGHALTLRPLVASADCVFSLHCQNPLSGTTLIVDGLHSLVLSSSYQVEVRRSPVSFKLARLRERTYFQNLTHKLQWGNRPIGR